MDIYGAHIHTQRRHGYLKVECVCVYGEAVNFKGPFVKSLLKFIKKWAAPCLFRNKIVMLIHFDCHIGMAKQNEWRGPDAPSGA